MKTFYRPVPTPAPSVALVLQGFPVAVPGGKRNSPAKSLSFRFHELDNDLSQAIALTINALRACSGRPVVRSMTLAHSSGSGKASAIAMETTADTAPSALGNRLLRVKSPLGRHAGIQRVRYAADKFD